MSKLFKGEAEIKEHLNDLINGKSSASKIKAACTLCFKYQQEYKLVVYEIEKFIKRVDIGDKLTSLYLLDAICRNSRAQVNNNKDKDIFSNRFAIRLKETVASLQYDSLSQADKLGCTKVFEEWRKRDIFSSDLIPVTALVSTLQREDIPFNNNNDNSNSINSNEYFNQSYMQMQPPVYAPPPPVFVQQPSAFPQQSILHTSRFNVTSNNEPLNTFNDMFNQQVHMQQQQQQMFQPPPTALVPPPVPPPPVPPIAPIPPGSKVDKKTKAAAEKKVKIAPKMCPFKQSDGKRPNTSNLISNSFTFFLSLFRVQELSLWREVSILTCPGMEPYGVALVAPDHEREGGKRERRKRSCGFGKERRLRSHVQVAVQIPKKTPQRRSIRCRGHQLLHRRVH